MSLRTSRIVVVLTAAACAACAPAQRPVPSLDPQSPMVAEMASVLALHGWPCDRITSIAPAEAPWAAVTCSDGSTYEVLVRRDWDWHALDRQTSLLPMIELGKQTQLLTAEDAATRRRAIVALGDMGPAAAPAVPALTEALDDPDPAVRASAADALAAIRGP